MPKITCYQCQQPYTDLEPYCPHCGAVRKEKTIQKTIRLARRALIGGGMGAAIGFGCALVLGIIFQLAKKQEGFWFETLFQTVKTMALIGFVIGGALGAAVIVVRDLVREE
jgi:predicted amidophosphoribosyltransferase